MPFRHCRPLRPHPQDTEHRARAVAKWGLKYSEWPRKYLPDYCIGWAFVKTPELAIRLAETATNLTPMERQPSKVCDYFITGVVRERIPGSAVDTLTNELSNNPWKNLMSMCPWLTEKYRHFIDKVVIAKRPYKPPYATVIMGLLDSISLDFVNIASDLLGYTESRREREENIRQIIQKEFFENVTLDATSCVSKQESSCPMPPRYSDHLPENVHVANQNDN